eukprot:CAMPEP_0168757646 /NCGR_PEP_ID=MMETSP0724-20121128/21283_1 /TAXON_ID=265536 /ORGANISM="Amphiprora sp., Strain CCMP467" /LENGTH=130 /DNA_ID=CAMNT_0008806481 /DNA_START=201 /DNA_END=592 /DNA_ORIENTATION=-
MVVRIRLQRWGNRGRAFYRMVAANVRAPRDGKFLEVLGTYNPIANSAGNKEIRLSVDRIKYWISVGAQPSDRAAWILGKFGDSAAPAAPHEFAKKEAQKCGTGGIVVSLRMNERTNRNRSIITNERTNEQ